MAAGKKIFANGRLNVDIVGQPVTKLAAMFGITVPAGTRVIIGEVDKVGADEPWSTEKLSPLLAMYRRPTLAAAVDTAAELVNFAGTGHTSVLYTNPQNAKAIRLFENTINTCRMLVNSPAAQGGIGDVYNFALDPSLTLGCGSWGDNSVSTNVTPANLLNIKTVALRRENMLWFRVPPKIYFKGGALDLALRELKGKKRAFIVTDKPLYDLGTCNAITKTLDHVGVAHSIFYDVRVEQVELRKGLAQLNLFNPDVIIAVGGGSPMDAAKVMWLMYEQPDTKFEGLSQRFMDIRKRVYDVPTLGVKAMMIAIPTTSGTGSEVTPFSVITDEATGMKYPLADYALTVRCQRRPCVCASLTLSSRAAVDGHHRPFPGDQDAQAPDGVRRHRRRHARAGVLRERLRHRVHAGPLARGAAPAVQVPAARVQEPGERPGGAREGSLRRDDCRHGIRQRVFGHLPLVRAQAGRRVPRAARPGQRRAHQPRHRVQRHGRALQDGHLQPVPRADGDPRVRRAL